MRPNSPTGSARPLPCPGGFHKKRGLLSEWKKLLPAAGKNHITLAWGPHADIAPLKGVITDADQCAMSVGADVAPLSGA